MLLLVALALAGEPLFDLAAVGTLGVGGATDGSGAFGGLGRGGLGLTGWLVPRLGLGGRIDVGSYGLLAGDDPNAFVFAALHYRATDTLTVTAGVGTPVVWVEYGCFDVRCPPGPWEYHRPIGALSAGWDLSRGALLLQPGLRAEVGGNRWGFGLDLAVGVRARRGDGG